MTLENSFEIRMTENSGRGLYATKEIEPGIDILVCDPTVYCLTKKYARTRCSYCTREASKLNRCGGCKLQWYCDKVNTTEI